jgi:hypothetical protein
MRRGLESDLEYLRRACKIMSILDRDQVKERELFPLQSQSVAERRREPETYDKRNS